MRRVWFGPDMPPRWWLPVLLLATAVALGGLLWLLWLGFGPDPAAGGRVIHLKLGG